MSRIIWQPEHPTPGWIQAEKDSDLTIYLPHREGDVPMFFRKIPATGPEGFRMGARGNSEVHEPVHHVTIPEDFYLGTFPVTQAQYKVMAIACRTELEALKWNKGVDPSGFKGDLRPVECVSGEDAMVVGTWLTNSGFLPAGLQARLPNEVMWEYGCRAGTYTDYWNGDGEAALAEVDWYQGNSGNETHPVGELRPNAFGMYDLHGNVWERCDDVWDGKAYRKRPDRWIGRSWGENDAGEYNQYINEEHRVTLGRDHIFRGGSWFSGALGCRSMNRGFTSPGFRRKDFGFRLCLFPCPLKDSRDLAVQSEQASREGTDGGAQDDTWLHLRGPGVKGATDD